MKSFTIRRCALAAIATAFALGFAYSTPVAFGDPVTFTIDSTRSSLTLSLDGSPGEPFTTAQFPGSDTTSLSGTQMVDVTGGSIQFLTTGNVQFALQPADVAPAAGGVYPGSAPGQFGLLAQIPGYIGGPGPGDTTLIGARDLLGNATSAAISLSGNSFDASQVVVSLLNGNADINSVVLGTPMVGTLYLGGGSDNNLATAGSLTTAGGIETLTLPIYAYSSLDVSGVTILETYTGQIVATAFVPEPSTWILAALGGLAFAAWRRRTA